MIRSFRRRRFLTRSVPDGWALLVMERRFGTPMRPDVLKKSWSDHPLERGLYGLDVRERQ
eukprot:COSAG02_NODE_44723_length_363_cov_1.375000_2_plen_59_part_01